APVPGRAPGQTQAQRSQTRGWRWRQPRRRYERNRMSFGFVSFPPVLLDPNVVRVLGVVVARLAPGESVDHHADDVRADLVELIFGALQAAPPRRAESDDEDHT